MFCGGAKIKTDPPFCLRKIKIDAAVPRRLLRAPPGEHPRKEEGIPRPERLPEEKTAADFMGKGYFAGFCQKKQ